MAKLSAHGTEIARLVTERPMPDFDLETHYSFRSDGHIMRRQVAVATRRDDHGWKLWKRLGDPKRDTAARLVEVARSMADAADADELAFTLTIPA